MSTRNSTHWTGWFTSVILVSVFAVSIGRIHSRVQTTLVGYDLGDLKESEALELERQSSLKMQLAKLTTRQHLHLMAGTEEEANSKNTLAVK